MKSTLLLHIPILPWTSSTCQQTENFSHLQYFILIALFKNTFKILWLLLLCENILNHAKHRNAATSDLKSATLCPWHDPRKDRVPGRHTRQRRPPIESLETQHSNYSTQTTLKYVDATVTKAKCVYPNGPILGRIFANWCSRDMLSDTLA